MTPRARSILGAVLVASWVLFASLVSASKSSKNALSRNFGPPVFFLQDTVNGECFTGKTYQRCGLNSLWYVTGKAGNYQLHHKTVSEDENEEDALSVLSTEDLCLVSTKCALTSGATPITPSDTSAVEIASCTHCGSTKWQIVGDNESGYVLTQNQNRNCLMRRSPQTNSSIEENNSALVSADYAELVSCEIGYSSFSLQFVSSTELNVLRSESAALVRAAFANDVPTVHHLIKDSKVDVNARDWDNVTAVIAAATAGHTALVKELIGSFHADATATDKDGLTALMEASRAKDPEIARFLLSDTNVDPHAVARSGVNALWMAASEGNNEILQLLIDRKVNPNAARIDGMSVLMVASADGHEETVQKLLSLVDEQGEFVVDVHAVDRNGANALIHASEKGALGIVEQLLSRKSNVNVMTENGVTALSLAATHGHLKVCEVLLDAGALLEPENQPENANALMFAATGGHTDVLELLLAKGIDINKRHNLGGTALQEACSAGQLVSVVLLVEKGANVNIADNEGVTPVMAAAASGKAEIVEHLLANGALMDEMSMSGASALLYSAGNGHLEASRALLARGANVNLQTLASPEFLEKEAQRLKSKALSGEKVDEDPHRDGVTPLMVAAQGGFVKVVELLLEFDADVTAVDDEDTSALQYALLEGHSVLAELLIKNGANPNDRYVDKAGYVHDLLLDAIQNKNEALSLLLIEKGANVSAIDEDNISPLIHASYLGETAVVSALLAHGSNVSHVNNEGITALVAAASEGHKDVAQLLIDAKCDVNARDFDGTTALMAAAVRGHTSIISLLAASGAAIDLQNNDGHTALMFAYNGKSQVHAVLQQYEAFLGDGNVLDNLNSASASNSSVSDELAQSLSMIDSALKQHTQTVAELLRLGASETLKDKEGHIAIDFDYQPPEETESPKVMKGSMFSDEEERIEL